MRRSLSVRIAMLLIVATMSAAPAFAAPRDDSPIPVMERLIMRIMQKINQKIRTILDTPTVQVPVG